MNVGDRVRTTDGRDATFAGSEGEWVYVRYDDTNTEACIPTSALPEGRR